MLVEFDQRGRVGGVIDRRFGENDPNMSVEQKMLERYAREKQRTSKFNFNLEDDEELTHYGQSLNALDDFDKSELRLEDDEETRMPQDEDDEDDDEDPDAVSLAN